MLIYTFNDATPENFDKFNRLIDFDFSEHYLNFIKKTNGGLVEESTSPEILIPSTDEKIKISLFYGMTDDDRDIVKLNKKYFELLPENSVIIAKSDMDGYFVVGQNDNGNSLYYWDVDNKLNVSSEDGNAFLVSNNSDDFWSEIGEIEIKSIADDKGENSMENVRYIPLGSIVLLNGSIQKLLVTSRGLIVNNSGQNVLFDYAGVLYPDGLVSDQIVYFNHNDIAKVVFEGYSDDDDKITVGNINKYIAEHPELERGSLENWKG